MSSARNVLDIKKAAANRANARDEMLPEEPRPRVQRLRDKRRRQRLLLGCICLMSALGLVGGIGALTHLEQLAISDVEVSGAAAIQPEALVASVQASLEPEGFDFLARDNMFLYPKRAVEATLVRDFPRIKEVAVSRSSLLAQAVTVSVEERQPYAKWCAETCFLMDSAGFVFAEAGSETPELAYEFRGGLAADLSPIGQWFLRGRLADAVGLMGRFEQAGFAATGLSVEDEQHFALRLVSGTELLLPFGSDAETLLHNLETALEAESLEGRIETLEYIDLRFGNRVYYK